MNPITHFLTGWTLARAAGLGGRETRWVAWASVLPDLDGLGAPVELLTTGTAHEHLWFSEYHHLLCHNLLFAALLALAAGLHCRRFAAAGWVALAVHLHLLADVAGGRGPDGEQWPIHYLAPFNPGLEWTWSGQWALNAWPNIAFTCVLMACGLREAWRHGRSPVELFSKRANRVLSDTLRKRFPSFR